MLLPVCASSMFALIWYTLSYDPPSSLLPLIRFGTSTCAYKGWQGQIYKRHMPRERLLGKVLVSMASISTASRLRDRQTSF